MKNLIFILCISFLFGCDDSEEFDPIEQEVIFQQVKKRIDIDFEERDYKVAEKRFDSLEFKNVNNFEFNYYGGLVREANKRNFEAAEFYKKALSIAHSETVYLQLALLYRDKIKDSANYILIIKKLIEVYPEKHIHYISYAEHFGQLGINSMAIDYVTKAMSLAPKSELPDLHVRRSVFRFRDGHYVEAIADCDSALSIDKYTCSAYIERTTWYLDSKQFKEAIKSATEGLKMPCNKGHLYYRRGLARYALDDVLNAKDDILKALELKNVEAVTFFKKSDPRFRLLFPKAILESI